MDSRHMRVAAIVLAALLTGGWPSFAAPPRDLPDPRISVAGTIRFPAEVRTSSGAVVSVDGLSGVAWLGADAWVAVMDTGDALVEFTLDLGDDGRPRAIRDERAVPFAARHDYEDVAVCPPDACGARASPAGRRFVVCEEDTPALRVVDATGAAAGTLPLPAPLATRRPNRGPEALCMAADGRGLWTANEEALPGDGPGPGPTTGTVVRLAEVPLAAGAPRRRQVAYAVDPPHAGVPVGTGEVYSGVVALAALPDGRLLVLERSARRGLPPFENRIYVVDPATAGDVADRAGGLADRPDAAVAKRLVWRGALGCNLEGLAIGPSLTDGGTVVVAVADAGGLDAPSQVVAFRMDAPVTTP